MGNMKGAYKQFDKKLHAANDEIAKKLSKKVLEKDFAALGITILENPDQYGVDMYLVKNEKIIGYVECEIKLVWQSLVFPYDSIQFPERKTKFAVLDRPTIFCMLNSMRNRMLCVGSKDLLSSPLVEVPNKYKGEKELFYQVPLKCARFYEVEQ